MLICLSIIPIAIHFTHTTLSIYVIVNAQAEGFMAINLPTPRAQPEGEVWFIAIKPEALGINYYISHLIGQLNKCSCHFFHSNKTG